MPSVIRYEEGQLFLPPYPHHALVLFCRLFPLNTAKTGINKSLLDEIGSGRGDVITTGSSIYIIYRDPFHSIRRGRQLFQRKFTRLQGQGSNEKDGVGDINTDIARTAAMRHIFLASV